MELYQKIVTARKQKRLTQEQLADLVNVTVRTIQRIENGGSTPRAYTLKTIATFLGLNFEELVANNDALINSEKNPIVLNNDDTKHYLKVLCLSCFSYLVVPFIHFLIPNYLLKKSNETNPTIITFAKKNDTNSVVLDSCLLAFTPNHLSLQFNNGCLFSKISLTQLSCTIFCNVFYQCHYYFNQPCTNKKN